MKLISKNENEHRPLEELCISIIFSLEILQLLNTIYMKKILQGKYYLI